MRNDAICPLVKRLSFSVVIVLCCLFSTDKIWAQPVVTLTPVITAGLSQPIQLVNAGDGSNRIFIVEKTGTIRVFDGNFGNESLFLTVSNVASDGERGLLSMAFHPDYKTNGFFYVYYVNTDGNLELARYQVSNDASIADATSKVIVITIPHPVNSNHNGGELHFGADGYLYLSTGDGGGSGDQPNNAQTETVLLGKILRFNVNTSLTAPFYTVPADNPFGNEVYCLGLRNPYRWSFDRLTNDMWIGDVGQDRYEEIDYRAAGSISGTNFGWHCYEGDSTYNTAACGSISNYIFPVYFFPTANPSGAVTGGVVYRGAAYPTLQGYNISTDFYTGIFYKTIATGPGQFSTSTQAMSETGIVNFGETEDGEAYAVSLTANTVYRIGTSGVLPVALTSFTGKVLTTGVQLNWQTAMEQSTRQFQAEYSMDGTAFSNAGTIAAKNAAAGAAYSFLHTINYDGTLFYRLKIISTDGTFHYSDIIRLQLHNKEKSIIAPSVINDGLLHVSLPTLTYNSLELISANGGVVLQKNIAGQSGNSTIGVGTIPAGVYTVRFTGSVKTTVQKILIH